MSNQRPWIPLAEAIELGGFSSMSALQSFLHRWNLKHPEQPIRRRWGKVLRQDFEAALELDSQAYTPQHAGAASQ